MEYQTISIEEYLVQKGIAFTERNGELITKCLFGSCDNDSTPKEGHLYFSKETGQYQCKKCGESGNLITLSKFLGDTLNDISLNPRKSTHRKRLENGGKITHQKITAELVEKCHASLPQEIKYYLHARGINDESINLYKIGFGNFYGKNWITIPIKDEKNEYSFFKLRKPPDTDENGSRYIVYPASSPAQLFGMDNTKGMDEIVICEGEFDCILLNQYGISAITSTAGATGFKNEWINKLSAFKKIYLCLDNDDPGKEETEKISKKIYEKIPGIEVYSCHFPERMTDGKDVTDYFTKYHGNPDELMIELAKSILDPNKPKRIADVQEPCRKIDFPEWQETIKANFPDLLFPSEVCLSIVTQILINDITNPFGLVLIDVPSSGKTITLNFFSDIDKLTYVTDKFTPASFISNSANVKKEKLKDIDLLPRLRYKTFIIRDLATLFSKREDDLSESLGILTRVLDGEGLSTDSGVHGQRQYTGEFLFMMLAASTPISPKVQKIMSNLGSRLFFLQMNTRDKDEDELVRQLLSKEYKRKEKECREATKQYLFTLWKQHKNGIIWNKEKDSQEYLHIISRCARLLSKLRGAINVWAEKGDIFGEENYTYTTPVIEKPDRINQLFYNIVRGHALACDRDFINEEDLKIIIELTMDSAHNTRALLFRKLIEHGGELKTEQVESILNCSKPTARKDMKALEILGVVQEQTKLSGNIGNPERSIKLNSDFRWFLSEESFKIRGLNEALKAPNFD